MRQRPWILAVLLLGLAATDASAQRPKGARPADGDDFADRMMAFDKNKDGNLTKDEVTDERLQRLFDRADANKDGTVTKDELTALAAREDRGGPGGGFGPPGGFIGGPPMPGQVLPPPLRQRLNLTAEQRAQVEELQKDVDARLDKILTSEQKAQLKQMRQRGPGGFGPPGGGPPGGFGPPDGGRPGRGAPPPDGRR